MDNKHIETVLNLQENVSHKVQELARNIYQEFELLIAQYGQNVVKNLMPCIVSLLENLENSEHNYDESKAEIELLREDNLQLINQYEKEKTLKRSLEHKYLELDDICEETKKEFKDKIKSLESLVHILELKSKNSSDHALRLEERESEWKKDYAKLHDRYSELFKTHLDFKEKIKLHNRTNSNGLPSPSDNEMSNKQAFFPSKQYKQFDSSKTFDDDIEDFTLDENYDTNDWTSNHDAPPIKKLNDPLDNDNLLPQSNEKSPNLIHDSGFSPGSLEAPTNINTVTSTKANSLTDNISTTDHIYAMGKEVENLIEENNELLATKNALNIVKDDLIMKVDELTSEQEILREEIDNLQKIKENFDNKIMELENELKASKEANKALLDKLDKDSQNESDESKTNTNNKRFTRVEMARVIMERNDYKARWLELQESVRWSETIKAAAADTNYQNTKANHFKRGLRSLSPLRHNTTAGIDSTMDRKETQSSFKYAPNNGLSSSIWNFFGQLFGGSTGSEYIPPLNKANQNISPKTSGEKLIPTFRYNAAKHRVIPGTKRDPLYECEKINRLHSGKTQHPNKAIDIVSYYSDQDENLYSQSAPDDSFNRHKRLHKKQNIPQRKKILPYGDDDGNYNAFSERIQAYGWSLPITHTQHIRTSLACKDKSLTTNYSASYHKNLENGLSSPTLTTSINYKMPNTSEHSSLSLPIPIYCRPLSADPYLTHLKILTACAINIGGGETRDGGKLCGSHSTFYDVYLNQKTTTTAIYKTLQGENQNGITLDKDHNTRSIPVIEDVHALEKEIEANSALLNAKLGIHSSTSNVSMQHETHLSSMIWIALRHRIPPRYTSNKKIINIGDTSDFDSATILKDVLSPNICIVDICNQPGKLIDMFNPFESIINQNITLPPREMSQKWQTNPTESETINLNESSFLRSANNSFNASSPKDLSSELQESFSLQDPSNQLNDFVCHAGEITCLLSVPGIYSVDYGKCMNEDILNYAGYKWEKTNIIYDNANSSHFDSQRSDINASNLSCIDETNPSLLLPTMWIAYTSGCIVILSVTESWRIPIQIFKLDAPIVSSCYLNNLIFFGLTNGNLSIFARNSDGLWDTSQHLIVSLCSLNQTINMLNTPKNLSKYKSTAQNSSPTCNNQIKHIISVCHRFVWTSIQTSIYVFDLNANSDCKSLQKDLNYKHSLDHKNSELYQLPELIDVFEADPRPENHIAAMVWYGAGVWVTYRMSAHLNLFHALTRQHLLRIDLQPFLETIIETETNLLFSHFDRITTLNISPQRLWVGTAKGSIISLPFTDERTTMSQLSGMFNDEDNIIQDPLTNSIYPLIIKDIPCVDVSDAQFSFHAHRDAVKFILHLQDHKGKSALGNQPFFIVSGGEGYIDYRNDDYSLENDGASLQMSKSLNNFESQHQNFKFSLHTPDENNANSKTSLEQIIQQKILNSYGNDQNNHLNIAASSDVKTPSTKLVPLSNKKHNNQQPYLIVWKID